MNEQIKVIQEAEESAGGLTNEGTTYERVEHIAGYIAAATPRDALIKELREENEQLKLEVINLSGSLKWQMTENENQRKELADLKWGHGN